MAVDPFPYLLLIFLSLCVSSIYGQVTVSTCTQLNNAIQQSNDGNGLGEIRVKSFINASRCNGLTPIYGSVSIVGVGNPPPTISGGNSVGLFSMASDNVQLTLKNLVLSQGKADYGGCVNVPYTQVSVSISNVKFEGCTATGGGALFLSGGPTILNSVEFNSNTAYSGGGIYNQGDGNQVIVINCIFKNNMANNSGDSSSGGAIRSEAILNISKSSFTQNSAISITGGAYGGGVFCSKSITVSDSIFSRNFASSSTSEVLGGALHSYSDKTITIINSKFERNSVTSLTRNGIGGAVFCTNLVVRSSEFNFNSIRALNPYGGAIYLNQKGDIFSVSFLSNSINSVGRTGAGGALYIASSEDSTFIARSNFSSNSVSASGISPTDDNTLYGGAVYSYTKLFSDRNNFISNSVVYTNTKFSVIAKGGAIHCVNDLSITFSTFFNNAVSSAASFAAGGAVFAENSLIILSSSFSGNNATSDCKLASSCNSQIWGGGAVYVYGQTLITLSSFVNNIFQSNSPRLSALGGAVFYGTGYGFSMTAKTTTFSKNLALAPFGNASGGAIGANSYYVVYSNNSRFIQNSAIGRIASGGGVNCGQGTFYCTNSTFTGNVADASSGDAYGGALDFSSSGQANTILFTTFQGNSAVSRARGFADGGAIFHGVLTYTNDNPLRIGYSKFIDNFAQGLVLARGGSLFIKSDHLTFFSRNYFLGSKAISARANGGAIFAGKGATLSFCAQNFFAPNNTAKSGRVTITDNIYTGGSAIVSFCPSITVAVDSSSTFLPVIQCQNCDCQQFFNPCDPIASCKQIDSVTYCTCPTRAPGSGFICGRVDTCSSTF